MPEPNASAIYTERVEQYLSFVSSFRHEQGIARLLFKSDLLRDDLRVLDAGCGTGFATFALLGALARRGLTARKIDAFDLTPAMLERFDQARRARGLTNLELRQADALNLGSLARGWRDYDLIISVSMLEYVPRAALSGVMRALRERLAPGGRLLLIVTRKNPVTRFLIEQWWHAHRYTPREFAAALAAAGMRRFRFTHYPFPYRWLDVSNLVVTAED